MKVGTFITAFSVLRGMSIHQALARAVTKTTHTIGIVYIFAVVKAYKDNALEQERRMKTGQA